MSYKKQNFVDDQILTADHLNHIEDGIENLEQNKADKTELFSGSYEDRVIIYPKYSQEEIQALLDEKGSLVFLPGNYNVNLNDDNMGYIVGSNTRIDFMDGAILSLVTKNTSFYHIVSVSGENIIINRPQIIGDRHTNSLTSGEWGHGISIMDSYNVTINDGYIKDCFGDGIYVGGTNDRSNYIYINNVICDNNRRQGISLVNCHDVYVYQCVLSNTNGTLPEAGLDIEPNSNDDSAYNIYVDKCEIFNNNGEGIDVLFSKQINITDSKIYNNNKLGIHIRGSVERPSDISVSNCNIFDNVNGAFSCFDFSTAKLMNNMIASSSDAACFRYYLTGEKRQVVISNNIINITNGRLYHWASAENISETIFNYNMVTFDGECLPTNFYGKISQFNGNIIKVNNVSASGNPERSVFINFVNKAQGYNNIFQSNISTKMFINNMTGSNNIYSEKLAGKANFGGELIDNLTDMYYIQPYTTDTLPSMYSLGETLSLANGDQNLPCATKQALLKTFRSSNASAYARFVIQFCYPANASDANIYMRRSATDTTWGEWFVIPMLSLT